MHAPRHRTFVTTSLLVLAMTGAGIGAAGAAINGAPATWTEPDKNTGTFGGALKGLATQGCKVWAVGEEFSSDESGGNDMTWMEYSSNGGRTWSLQTNPTPLVTLNKVGFDGAVGFAVGEPAEHPGSPNKYAGRGTILKTTNNGRSWQDITALGPDVPAGVVEDLEGLSVVSSTNVYIAGGTWDGSGVILHSRNGRVFTAQTLPTTEVIADVYFADARRGWAVTDGGTILATVNGGAGATGWKIQSPSDMGRDAERIKFAPDARTGMVIGGDNNYATTTDGGAHWTQRRYNTDSEENVGMKDVTFTSNSHVWIAAEINGNTGILESFDGGVTLVKNTTPKGDNMQAIGMLPHGAGIAVGADRHALVTGNSGC